MIKLHTPLVIGTIFVVTVLGIARIVLFPDAWISSLAALLFLPAAIGMLVFRNRLAAYSDKKRKVSGMLRAALVGAGVLLATALLLSIMERLGLTEQPSRESPRSLLVMLPAVVAFMADLLSTSLERKAEKESD